MENLNRYSTLCIKLFKTEKAYRSHVVVMHPDLEPALEKLEFCCTKCIKSFDCKSSLSRHNAEHKKQDKLKAELDKAQSVVEKLTKERNYESEIRELRRRNDELSFYLLSYRRAFYCFKEGQLSINYIEDGSYLLTNWGQRK